MASTSTSTIPAQPVTPNFGAEWLRRRFLPVDATPRKALHVTMLRRRLVDQRGDTRICRGAPAISSGMAPGLTGSGKEDLPMTTEQKLLHVWTGQRTLPGPLARPPHRRDANQRPAALVPRSCRRDTSRDCHVHDGDTELSTLRQAPPGPSIELGQAGAGASGATWVRLTFCRRPRNGVRCVAQCYSAPDHATNIRRLRLRGPARRLRQRVPERERAHRRGRRRKQRRWCGRCNCEGRRGRRRRRQWNGWRRRNRWNGWRRHNVSLRRRLEIQHRLDPSDVQPLGHPDCRFDRRRDDHRQGR